jgi:hypothetical protein
VLYCTDTAAEGSSVPKRAQAGRWIFDEDAAADMRCHWQLLARVVVLVDGAGR